MSERYQERVHYHASQVSRPETDGAEVHQDSWEQSLRATLGTGVELWSHDHSRRLAKEGYGRLLSVPDRERLAAIAEERLWPNACPEPNSGCVLWTGRLNQSGYGNISVALLGTRQTPAHRFSWIVEHGFVPVTDICVCHRCDTRPCVNPLHLFLGTRGDNARDMVQKGRQNNGREQHLSKLSDDDVRAIRESNDTDEELSLRYGVARQTINTIMRRKTWEHVS
jgi:HNH endonuclease